MSCGLSVGVVRGHGPVAAARAAPGLAAAAPGAGALPASRGCP